MWYDNALPRDPSDGSIVDGTRLSDVQSECVSYVLNNCILPHRFAQLEELATRSSGAFVCGDRMTVADLELFVLLRGLQDGSYCEGIDPDVVSKCPRLLAIARRVQDATSVPK